MSSIRWYVTAAIPYVNADPHLGHALEFVEADALARWRRLRGDRVRSLWGTDDNAFKNVRAAREAGIPTQRFVDQQAARFAALSGDLELGFDDFIRTSRDPRHKPGVERLWRACRDAGDLYRGHYEGPYCPGCEQFFEPGELEEGRCPEHGAVVEQVAEHNWFFRLSRYAEPVLDAIRSGALRVAPAHRRNEIISFLAGKVRDVSVSRPAERSGGWGIPAPDDPDQVIYVWFDALVNYISALGYGTGHADFDRWWAGADRRVHVVGKGITRFHAAYWPAFLLSAREALPTDVLVHEYLTVDGAKISKSGGTTVDVHRLVEDYGSGAVRWWLLRDVNPSENTDFRRARLVQRHDQDLANGLGNLLNRVVGLIRRRGRHDLSRVDTGVPVSGPQWLHLDDVVARVDAAVERLDFRAASSVLWELVVASNGRINQTRPWELVGDPQRAEELDRILGELLEACGVIGRHLQPFLPQASDRLTDICASVGSGRTQRLANLFPRLSDRYPQRPESPDGTLASFDLPA
jgi:methionyl-tRNA synthetase